MTLLQVVVCLAVFGNDADDVLNDAKKIRERKMEQFVARMDKQVLCHLTPAGMKIFTPNRPVEDKGLMDRVLPANELVVTCDALDQTSGGTQPSWKFIGNVRVLAAKVVIQCHEATVTQDAECLSMDISGGQEADPFAPPAGLSELSSPNGYVLIAGERRKDAPFEFESSISVLACQLKQKLDTGTYAIKHKIVPVPLAEPVVPTFTPMRPETESIDHLSTPANRLTPTKSSNPRKI